MNLIKRSDAPTFNADDLTVTAYASPSRGAAEISLWHLELAAGSASPLHHMDCEEVFLALEGRTAVVVDGVEHELAAGDCLILPAGSDFSFRVAPEQPFRALGCIRAGGMATMAGGDMSFLPPWTE